eukprot:SAG31_NODE_7090_length_1791_cov_2.701537_2_plen_132_part_00
MSVLSFRFQKSLAVAVEHPCFQKQLPVAGLHSYVGCQAPMNEADPRPGCPFASGETETAAAAVVASTLGRKAARPPRPPPPPPTHTRSLAELPRVLARAVARLPCQAAQGDRGMPRSGGTRSPQAGGRPPW